MITLSWYHDTVIMIMLSCYHNMITLSCYQDNIIMMLSCYHDNFIMLSYVFPENFTHWSCIGCCAAAHSAAQTWKCMTKPRGVSNQITTYSLPWSEMLPVPWTKLIYIIKEKSYFFIAAQPTFKRLCLYQLRCFSPTVQYNTVLTTKE
jgi:hypothetical protein